MAILGLACLVTTPPRDAGPYGAAALQAMTAEGGLITLLFVCVKIGRVIDVSENTLTTHWSVLGIGRTNVYPLAAFDRITIDGYFAAATKGWPRRFRIYLTCQAPGRRPRHHFLQRAHTWKRAKRCAETVSHLTGLPIKYVDHARSIFWDAPRH